MAETSFDFNKVLSILNTPGGAALVNAAGAGIGAYGANKSAQADRDAAARENQLNRQMTAHQFAANNVTNQFNADRNFQQNAVAGALEASPLGAEQQFAQRMALALPILQNARNFSATPGDPAVAAAMGGGLQGGLRLPEGGLDPAMLQRMFGPETTMNSIASRQKTVGQLNPRGSAMNLGSMFGDAGTAASEDVASATSDELARQQAEQQRFEMIRNRAIDEDIRGERQPKGQAPEGYEYDKKTGELKKKGGSFWKKLGKVGLIAGGGIATALTGGAAAPLIGAAVGAGTGAIDGGLKGAIMGGGLGALTGGIGGGGATAAKQGIGQAVKSTFTNPNNLLRMGGTAVGGGAGAAMNIAGSLGAGNLLRRPGMPELTTTSPNFNLQNIPQFPQDPQSIFNPYGPGVNPWDNVTVRR